MRKSSKVFVGLDVRKESIASTLIEVDGDVRRCGEVDEGWWHWARHCVLSMRVGLGLSAHSAGDTHYRQTAKWLDQGCA